MPLYLSKHSPDISKKWKGSIQFYREKTSNLDFKRVPGAFNTEYSHYFEISNSVTFDFKRNDINLSRLPIGEGVQVDDLRLLFALLHSNVDQFIAHKIMTVFASRIKMKESTASSEQNPKFYGCMKMLRPSLQTPSWLNKKNYSKIPKDL